MPKKRLTSKGIVHLAGTPVTIGDRVIQRCLICGCKLLDSEDPVVNVIVDEGQAKFYTWVPGGWIQVNHQSAYLLYQSETPEFTEQELPSNNCMGLVE